MQFTKSLPQLMAILYISVYMVISIFPASAENDIEQSKLAAGRSVLSVWQKEAVKPRYGACWAAALEALDAGCKQLTEEIQHRLTLHFTNCFLVKTGRRKHDCESFQPIEECVGDMSSEAYGVYAEFFAHTQSVCFYLEAESWQTQSENLMLRLANNSAAVSEQMENASSLQIELLRKQNDSLVHQQTILETGKQLKQTIEASKIDVHMMMTDFKATTAEQRALIFDVFDRVRSLQSLVLDEFTGIYSIVCYVCATVLVYILTSAPRTAGARVWLFLTVICCALTESAITFWMCDKQLMERSGTSISDEERAGVHAMVRWCRRIYVLVALLIYGWIAYHYEDYNIINNRLLLDIKHQIQLQHSEIKNWIPTGELTSRLSMLASVNPLNVLPCSPPQQSLEFRQGSRNRFSTTSDDSTDDDDDDDDDDDGDRTFRGSRYGGSSSDSDLSNYSMMSRSTTRALLEELEDLRRATPLRELSMSSRVSSSSSSGPVQNLIGLWHKRSDDVEGSNASTEHSITASLTTTHSYNLRLRSANGSPAANPILQHESPRSFARELKVNSKLSIQRRDTVESTPHPHRAASPSLNRDVKY